jgi:hypothetical protein
MMDDIFLERIVNKTATKQLKPKHSNHWHGVTCMIWKNLHTAWWW